MIGIVVLAFDVLITFLVLLMWRSWGVCCACHFDLPSLLFGSWFWEGSCDGEGLRLVSDSCGSTSSSCVWWCCNYLEWFANERANRYFRLDPIVILSLNYLNFWIILIKVYFDINVNVVFLWYYLQFGEFSIRCLHG